MSYRKTERITIEVVGRNDQKLIKGMPVVASESNLKLNFYLETGTNKYYLFQQRFSKGVYEYFRNGVTFRELNQYKKWNKNPRLAKTIGERIPQCRNYVLREFA